MIPSETINKFIRDITNLLVETADYAIKSKQSGAPRPTGDYADVDMVTDMNIGWEQRVLENNQGDDDLTENISGMREITMSVNFYRTLAIDNAKKVRTGLFRESIQQLFSAAGLGLISRSAVREISEPLENGWEERAQFDIVLSAVGTDSDIIRSILSVDMAGQYQTHGLTYNFNIEV